MKNDHLVLQIVCFRFTLVLLAISFFVFKDDVKAHIVLVIVGAPASSSRWYSGGNSINWGLSHFETAPSFYISS